MGFCEVLTIIFVVLKLIGQIDWSWWLVLLPEIIAGAFYIVAIAIHIGLSISIHKQRKELRKRWGISFPKDM